MRSHRALSEEADRLRDGLLKPYYTVRTILAAVGLYTVFQIIVEFPPWTTVMAAIVVAAITRITEGLLAGK